VTIPHGNVLALVAATAADLELTPDDVWSFFHSVAFDFSVWEIWGCLLTGGRLVVTPYWTARSAADFHALLAAEAVTVLSQTPSAFMELDQADQEAGDPLAVRLLVFGGESLDTGRVAGWFRRHPPAECRVVNLFGITEATVHATLQTLTPRDVRDRSRSVGFPLAGWSCSVRDQAGRIRPVGAAGEIWVGGAGLARGYLGRPELTDQRFVTDGLSGERVYRSGDLGRLRPDGRLEHLGRMDDQVKLRGHRIELGEIRSVLAATDGVLAAAVVVHRGGGDNAASDRIEAFVVLGRGGNLSEVGDSVARALPDYMIPAMITPVDALPLTLNGKLDTARLPLAASPPVGRPLVEPPPPAPTSDDLDLLTSLQQIWNKVLDAAVGPGDNFFLVGGNSLHVIRTLREMRALGLPRISAEDFYRNATLTELVALLRRVSAQQMTGMTS
jgi:acyl-coenzyme A synthetase/AMP-(fatty) acid ligase